MGSGKPCGTPAEGWLGDCKELFISRFCVVLTYILNVTSNITL